ncbi:reverse transcriptase domain-containing protein [Tanacetum coccineum]
MTIVLNDNNELIPSRIVTGSRVCIDYSKLNDATQKDHFPLPFIDQMLERLSGNEYYHFLDGFSGFFQIAIAPEDQEKTMFTCPYGTFAYRRMSFGLCNAPATFQRCMTAIFHDMVEDFMEVFMDNFLVFGNSSNCCLANLDKTLSRCVSDISELRLQEHWDMLDVTSGDARSWYMISGDAKSWVCLHIFTVILHNCPLFEILAQQLGLRNEGQGGQVGGQGREVNDGVDGVPDFSTIIAQQLRNLLPTIIAQVGDQGRGQGNGKNQNGDAINDNIRGDVSRGCTYKEFLACNPKEYDCKGGAIVYTRWIEKMEAVHGSHMVELSNPHTRKRTAVGMSWEDFKTLTREEFCPSNEMQKLETELWNHVMVGAGHVAYTDRFHKLARLVPHLVTPKGKRIKRYVYGLALQIQGMVAATEPKTIQKAVQIAGTLTDEALRNGSIKKKP